MTAKTETESQITDPTGFAGRLDGDDNLGISLCSVLSTVKGGHPECKNALTL